MIIYDKQVFGLNLLFRVHGSAVYRSVVPAFLSMACVLLFRYLYGVTSLRHGHDDDIQHPYMVGVLISSTTFLIVFRANNAYSRYWEAATAVHHMMGKWMDATIHTSVFHLQCDHYNHIKPPNYYDNHDLNQFHLTRARERILLADPDGGEDSTSGEGFQKMDGSNNTKRREMMKRASVKSINVIDTSAPSKSAKKSNSKKKVTEKKPSYNTVHNNEDDSIWSRGDDDHNCVRRLLGQPKLDGNWSGVFNDGTSTYFNPFGNNKTANSPFSRTSSTFTSEGATTPLMQQVPSFASHQGGRTPALFLQELAHLSSLLCAVALSTLRNDIDGAQSPLGVYTPGAPWPEVDSDHIENFGTTIGGSFYSRAWKRFLYLLGAGKSPEERTRYNAARPMPVIGGVSDNEIMFLQMARGPYAKTMLVWNWLSEFMMREHLAGSMGKVGPPIISRLIQFMSDGMIFYNHARKIMFIPFPFPHAQLSSLFIFVCIPAIAFLMDQFIEGTAIACALSFLSVLCLSGIHEVARELENPFRNIPNELPLVTFQAQFNEALITMYSGFHPDHFWDPDEYRNIHNNKNEMDDIAEEEETEREEQEESEQQDATKSGEMSVEEQRQHLELLETKMQDYAKEITALKLAMQSGMSNQENDNLTVNTTDTSTTS